jgi:guanylate kinase
MSEGKLVIFSAPSGAGKTTIVRHLLDQNLNFGFSISATTRKPRGTEQNGKEYYFLSTVEFRIKISNGDFLEWEEVYPGCFYGTLKSEVDRIFQNGQNILFDIDVEGGSTIKKHYGEKALAVFIQPPSIKELENRLIERSTDPPEVIRERIAKAEHEMGYIGLFDIIIINDKLEVALREAEEKIRYFLEKGQVRK